MDTNTKEFPWIDTSLSPKERASLLVANMDLDQKSTNYMVPWLPSISMQQWMVSKMTKVWKNCRNKSK